MDRRADQQASGRQDDADDERHADVLCQDVADAARAEGGGRDPQEASEPESQARDREPVDTACGVRSTGENILELRRDNRERDARDDDENDSEQDDEPRVRSKPVELVPAAEAESCAKRGGDDEPNRSDHWRNRVAATPPRR